MKHSSKSPLVNTASILAGTEKLAAPAARSLTQLAHHLIRQRFPVFLAIAALLFLWAKMKESLEKVRGSLFYSFLYNIRNGMLYR